MNIFGIVIDVSILGLSYFCATIKQVHSASKLFSASH